VSGPTLVSYVHTNFKNAALIVAKAGSDVEKLKMVAMHIVATNPQVLAPTDISDETVAKEKEIQLALMKEDPKNATKPTEILERIIEGKMTKFREENALLTQQFVVNPDQKVGEFIGDVIVSFKRFSI
jgi:elongation factor Ts